ncbi:EF hand domain [Trypanosoma vivax]|uniref:Putative calmodulin n=1 Tax=Trypanosoma vivax (strain Y486) TaxID=1055687 RepID=G0TXC8_TRYVY|nr:EF hand domain [Trypanosoma vivax]CCC48618.1 putative calmodulin [Trypanosoma vivax Y486]
MFVSGTISRTSSVLSSLSPEEIDMLRDAFIYMDRDNDGHVGKNELLAMVLRCVGHERYGPLKSYLVPLFDVADKDKDNRLSLSEFLLSFADGPGVVPAEVINSCVSSIRVRLTDEEIVTLQESFRRIDTKADGYIDKEELIVALKDNLKNRFPDLTDNNYRDIVSVIMASADSDHDGRLCLAEFIRSFQEDQGVLPAVFVDAQAHQMVQYLTPAEVDVLKEAFTVLDKNNDGFVELSDMYEALWETVVHEGHDRNQVHELCDLLMVTADRSNGDVMSLDAFIRGFIRNMTLAQLPVAAAQEKVRTACERLQQMLMNGELEQLSIFKSNVDGEGGSVNPYQLVRVLSEVFREVFPSLDENTLSSVVGAIVVASSNTDNKKFSVEDFVACFTERSRCLSLNPCFPDSDSVSAEDVRIVSQFLKDMGKHSKDGSTKESEVMTGGRGRFNSGVLNLVNAFHSSEAAMGTLDGVSSTGVGATGECAPIPDPGFDESVLENEVPQASLTVPYEGSAVACKEVPVQEAGMQDAATGPSSSVSRTVNSAGRRLSQLNTTVSDVLLRQRARRCLSAHAESGSSIYDRELLIEFKKYAEGKEYIDRERFIEVYLSMEHYGLIPSRGKVNELISHYCKGNRLTFEEFSIIMLQRARL